MARDAPAAPFSSFANCSIITYLLASPRPRPPDTTMFASSSFGPVDSSTCDACTDDAPVAPTSGTGASTTDAAPPPDSSGANDFGRKTARYGPGPVKVVV